MRQGTGPTTAWRDCCLGDRRALFFLTARLCPQHVIRRQSVDLQPIDPWSEKTSHVVPVAASDAPVLPRPRVSSSRLADNAATPAQHDPEVAGSQNTRHD